MTLTSPPEPLPVATPCELPPAHRPAHAGPSVVLIVATTVGLLVGFALLFSRPSVYFHTVTKREISCGSIWSPVADSQLREGYRAQSASDEFDTSVVEESVDRCHDTVRLFRGACVGLLLGSSLQVVYLVRRSKDELVLALGATLNTAALVALIWSVGSQHG